MPGLLDFFGMNSNGGGLLGFGAPQNQPMNIMPLGAMNGMGAAPPGGGQLPLGLDPNIFARQIMQGMHAAPQMSPLTTFGLGLASGGTASEGIGGALKAMQTQQAMQHQQTQDALKSYVGLRGLEDKPAFGQIGEDAFGNKQFGFINSPQQKITPVNANAGPSVGGAPGGDSSFFAKGVSAINHDLKGEDYLAQFSPEVQSAVKNYVGGQSMPTGNPRKGFTQTIKMLSQKYGDDIGTPADDASFSQRNQMLKNLAITTPGSLGGQINFAGTALEHLAQTSEKINDLNNVNGLGIAPLAKLVNSVRQLTTEQAGKANAVTGAAQHYGQEVTKFYSGSPGGEGERTRFMNTLSTAKSPTELADAIQTERDLIPGRLDQLANQIKTTLGDTPQGQKQLARIEESKRALPRIDAAIAKLRGQEPAAAPAAAPPAAPMRVNDKASYDRLAPGASYIAPDGSLRTKQ